MATASAIKSVGTIVAAAVVGQIASRLLPALATGLVAAAYEIHADAARREAMRRRNA